MKKIIGIMGGGENALEKDLKNAYEIGKFSAENNFVVLTGGRNVGVMNEALKGAKEVGGLTVGILPTDDKSQCSKFVDIPIFTNMRSARNYINILSSNIIISCGMELGTSTEVSLALKNNKKVVLVGACNDSVSFYKKFGKGNIYIAESFLDACTILNDLFNEIN